MPFKKGNKLATGGKRATGGRKKKLSTLMNEAMRAVDQRLPDLYQMLIDRAIEDKDREAAMYLIDRRQGKPTVKTDINLEGGKDIAKGTITAMMEAWDEARKGLEQGIPTIQIEGGNDAIQRQGEAEGVLEGQEASAEGVHPR